MNEKKQYTILLVNDDGIGAPGIEMLAALVKDLGTVYVVAPMEQCSAMSHRITIREKLIVRSYDFPVEGVQAYAVSGTPADCVKVAIHYLLPEKPDLVLSGINNGYNTAFDISYSATVAAAMEAKHLNIPSIAFSNRFEGSYEIVKKYFPDLLKELLRPDHRLLDGEIWNVNFPGCEEEDFQGIYWNAPVSGQQLFTDYFESRVIGDGELELSILGYKNEKPEKDTDMDLVYRGYITISRIRSMVYS